MAQTGFGMGFDLDGLDRALRSADKGIQDLAKQAEVQTKRISDAFSLGATKGISQLSRELSDVKSGLAELTNKNYEIKLSSNNFGQEVIDEVNRVINYTRQEFERVSREKVSKFLIPDAPSRYNFGMNAPSVDLSSIDSIIARMNVLKEALDTGELNNRKVDDALRVQINDETKALNEWLGVLKMSTDEFNAAKTAQARSILETAQMQIDATNAEIKRREDEKAATLQSISEKAAAQQEYNSRMTALREGENAAMERQLAYYKESQSALAEINNIQAIAKDTEKNAKDTKLVENAKEVYAELEEQKRIHQERMKAITERYPVETELIDKDFAIKNFVEQAKEEEHARLAHNKKVEKDAKESADKEKEIAAKRIQEKGQEVTEEMKYQQRMLEVRQAANKKQKELLRDYESSLKEVRSLEAQQMVATDVFVNSKDKDKVAMAKEVYYGIEEELNMHKQRMIAIEEKYPVETQLLKEQAAKREFIRQSEEDLKESERRKAEIIAQNQQTKSNNQNYQRQWKEQADAYVALFDEAIKREEKNKADARNYELQGFLDLQNKKKQAEADMRSIEQRNHAEKLKEYEELFAALDRTEKRRKAIYNATADSSQGATHYADRVLSSQKPKTVENLQKAISRAQEAQKRLNLDTEEGKKKYAQLSETIKKCELEIKKATWSSKNFNNANDELSKTATRLKQTLVAAFSVSSLFGYAKKVMEVRGEFEMQHKAMQVLIGDQFKANKLWEQTVQLAVKSPFRVKELVTYTKQLSAYRIETELLHDKTKMLADISAGLGVDMNRLILAYGQVKAANYLRGTELRQFSEAGINVLQELSEYFTEIEGRAVSVGDVFERVSKRMVSFADVDAVLQKVTSEGGEFYKMQEKQSETLQGMLRNLTDSIDLMMNEIGKSNEGMTKGALSAVKTLIDHWRFFAEMLKGGVVALSITLTIKSLNSMSRSMYKAAASAKTFSVTNNKLANSLKRLTVSVRSLTKAMLANPLFLGAAAITAGLAIISLIRSHNKEVKAANKIYEEAAANEINRGKRLKDLSESISANNAVIKKGEENTKEYSKAVESNKSLLKELNKEYPTLSSQIKTNGDNTIELTDAVKEHNNKLRENIALQYQAKGSFFQDDLSTNYQDVIKEQADVQKAIENTKGAAQAFASQLEFSYQQELVDDKQYKKFKQLADAIYEAKDAADIRDLDLSIISDVTRDMGRGLKGSANDLSSELRTLMKEVHGEATAYLRLQGNIENQQSSIKNSIKSINDEVERGVWVESYLDQFNFVDKTVRDWAKKVIEKMVEVTIVYPEKGDGDNSLEPWAERVKDAITEVNNKIKESNKDISDTELFPLPTAGQTREQYLDVIKPFLETAKAEYAVGQKIVDDSTIAQTKALKPYADAVERILNIMEKTSEEDEALQILKKQIKLIRDAARAYDDMRKLHDKAYADEQIVKEYGSAFKEAKLGDIGGYAFGTRQDEQNNLEKLRASAEKTTDGVLELNKAIAQVGVNIDDANQEFADKKLFDAISDIFSNYEISLEMDKLNIPKDLASKLFGFDAIDLDDIRWKVLDKFGMGAYDGYSNEQIYDSNAFNALSEERQKNLREALEKEEELQNESLERRMKDYEKYLKHSSDEVLSIQNRGALRISFGKELFEEGKISAEEFALSIKRIVKETNEEVGKVRLDELKNSPLYIEAIGSVYGKTKAEIQKMIDELENLKEANKESMSPEEAKAYSEAIIKLKKEQQDIKPFFYDDNIKKIKDYITIEKELTAEKEKQKTLEEQKKNQEENLASLQDLLSNLQNEPQDEGTVEQIQFVMSNIEEVNGELASTNSQLTETGVNIKGLEGAMEGIAGGASGALMMVDAIIKEVYRSTEATIKMFNDVKELAESYGADTGNEAWSKASSVMNTMGEVNNEVMQGFENIKSGNIVGAIANTIGAITKLIKGINEYKDIGFAKEIERQAKNIERLEKSYEKLEKAMDEAYSIEQMKEAQDAMSENINGQIEALERQKAAEESKKNTDQEAVDDYADQIEELEARKAELQKELVEKMGGTYDYSSVAEQFLDAWLTAFKETGDGLSGLEKEFDSFWKDILKKQVIHGVDAAIVQNYVDEINNALKSDSEDGSRFSENEKKAIEDAKQRAMSNLNEFYDFMNEQYGLSDMEGAGLTGIQSGISGMTEEQADILAAYWNSVRLDVSDIRSRLENYMNKMFDNEKNPMLSSLQAVADRANDIHQLLKRVSGASIDGDGIRVIVKNWN